MAERLLDHMDRSASIEGMARMGVPQPVGAGVTAQRLPASTSDDLSCPPRGERPVAATHEDGIVAAEAQRPQGKQLQNELLRNEDGPL